MLDSPHLLPFDLFQQLVIWLGTSMHTSRKGRRFLEHNQVLLRVEIERELERLIIARVEEKVEMKQQMQYHQALLQTARERGGSQTAIREAYINAYGGFTLDLPNWLEEIEQKRAMLLRLQRPERTTKAQIQLLQQARDQALTEPDLPPEITAELSNRLGFTLLQGPLPETHMKQLELLEETIACHKAAINIYTYARYPLQYAHTCIYLGTAYQRYGTILHKQEDIERALTYYKSALWIYNRNEHPEQWAMLQTLMGNVYTLRSAGGRQNNLDYAIFCHESALQVLPEDDYPEVWARAQVHLGDSYQLQLDSKEKVHLSHALVCYRLALHIYTKESFPREWADTHTKLAAVFQKIEGLDEDRRDNTLGCAIVCCELALQAYTIDSYPVEYAKTQLQLGQAHAQRGGDERHHHLEQAMKSFKEALRIFSRESFPLEYEQVKRYYNKANHLALAQYSEMHL